MEYKEENMLEKRRIGNRKRKRQNPQNEIIKAKPAARFEEKTSELINILKIKTPQSKKFTQQTIERT